MTGGHLGAQVKQRVWGAEKGGVGAPGLRLTSVPIVSDACRQADELIVGEAVHLRKHDVARALLHPPQTSVIPTPQEGADEWVCRVTLDKIDAE